MVKSVLIPVALDHESLVEKKIATARRIMAGGGTISLLTVLEQIPGFTQEFVTVKSENHLTNKVMENLKRLANGADDIKCFVESGKPGLKIVEFAEDNGIDLIIVGAHHPTAMDYFLGSTAARVARRAKCSVLVERQD